MDRKKMPTDCVRYFIKIELESEDRGRASHSSKILKVNEKTRNDTVTAKHNIPFQSIKIFNL